MAFHLIILSREKKGWVLEYYAIHEGLLMVADENNDRREVANLMLATVRPMRAPAIDRNFCFEIIMPGTSILVQVCCNKESGPIFTVQGTVSTRIR